MLPLGPCVAEETGGHARPDAVEEPLAGLLTALTGWVADHLGEPVPASLPRLVVVERSALKALWALDTGAGLRDPHPFGRLHALYEPGSHTIYLPSDWTGTTAAEVSVLVDEIVHHFQALRGDSYPCAAEKERLAFDVQSRWLSMQGESLENAFDLDPLALLFLTNCIPEGL